MSTGGGKITDALLAQLTEKRELYAKLETEYNTLLEFIESFERDTSLASREGLDSSGSEARKARGLGRGQSIEEEVQTARNTARNRARVLKEKLNEIQNEIEAFEDLLKG